MITFSKPRGRGSRISLPSGLEWPNLPDCLPSGPTGRALFFNPTKTMNLLFIGNRIYNWNEVAYLSKDYICIQVVLRCGKETAVFFDSEEECNKSWKELSENLAAKV